MAEPQRKAALIEPGAGAQLSWLGSRSRYLAVGEQTASRYAVSITLLPPGTETTPLVRRRDHAGLYVLAGEVSVAAGDRTIRIPPHGFLNVAPGTAYRLANPGPDPAEVFTIAAPAGFEEFQFRTGFPLPRPGETAPPVTAADLAAVAAIAPGYGVDPSPPPSAFAHEPRARFLLPPEERAAGPADEACRLLATADDTDGRYAFWHMILPAGVGQPLHLHSREDEAVYVLRGAILFQADAVTRTFGPGGFAHLPSGVRHRFANASNEPAEALVLVAPAGLEQMFESAAGLFRDPFLPADPPSREEAERRAATASGFGIELIP